MSAVIQALAGPAPRRSTARAKEAGEGAQHPCMLRKERILPGSSPAVLTAPLRRMRSEMKLRYKDVSHQALVQMHQS